MPRHRDLAIAAAALVLLPFALGALGLGITSASEAVIFAMACMALNILVGYTGLVSFGHGAWFGLAAYAAAMAQRELFKGSFLLPLAIGLAALAGVMLAPIFAVHPAMGQEIITSAFVVVVIGGLGSFWGVVIAAVIVGVAKGMVTALGYPQYSEAAIYLLMLLVLLVRPRGLLGERIVRFE
jgi:branched-subunit amino acid ABC-type transport system permease component